MDFEILISSKWLLHSFTIIFAGVTAIIPSFLSGSLTCFSHWFILKNCTKVDKIWLRKGKHSSLGVPHGALITSPPIQYITKSIFVFQNEKKGKQMKRCVFKPKRNDGYIQFVSDKYGVRAKTPRYLAFRETGQPKHFSKIFGDRQHATRFVIDQGKSPQKRSVKRNIRRRQLLRQDELLFQEKNKHKRKRLCLIYLRCLNKKWKLNRRKEKITIRCTRRQNYCNCKCTKQ